MFTIISNNSINQPTNQPTIHTQVEGGWEMSSQ